MSSKERATKLLGAMVIALKEGERLGWVSELYVDKTEKRIQGMAYRSSTFKTNQEIYVGFGDILKFSRDFVIVAGRGESQAVPEEAASNGLKALKGCQVTTQAGKHVTTLVDLVLDREDGKIVQLLVPENRVLRIDMGDVHFGPDLVMVPAGYEPATDPSDVEPDDFAARFLRTGSISNTVREGYAGVRNAVRHHINTETVKKTWESGSQTARKTILRTSQAIQQGIDQIMKRRQSEKNADKPTAEAPITPMDATEPYTDSDRPDPIVELAPESVDDGQAPVKPKEE